MKDSVIKKKKIVSIINEQVPLVENGMINNLPDDCLLYIFSYVPAKDLQNLENVCSRWASVAPHAWKNLKSLNLDDLREDETIFKEIWSRCGHSLTKIQFTVSFNDELYYKQILSKMPENCKKLEEITIRFNAINERGCLNLENLFKVNQNLRCTKFENVSAIPMKLKNRLFEALPNDLKKITLLRFISGENKRRYQLPLQILSKFTKLNYLELEDFVIHPHELKTLKNSQNLTTLKLHNINMNRSTLNEITLLENLQNLELSCVTNLNRYFFVSLYEKCTKLNSIRFSRCQPITEYDICSISLLPNLRNLNLECCRGDQMPDGFDALKKLKKLTCTCYHESEGYNYLKRGIVKLIEVSSNIEFIDLSYSCISYRMVKAIYRAIKDSARKTKLEIVIPDALRDDWIRKSKKTSLLIVTSTSDYVKRNKSKE